MTYLIQEKLSDKNLITTNPNSFGIRINGESLYRKDMNSSAIFFPANSYSSSSSASPLSFNLFLLCRALNNTTKTFTPTIAFHRHGSCKTHIPSGHLFHRDNVALRVTNESSRLEVSSDDISGADKIVDGMDFGELCNEFECKSSPLVESTARQLVRDILQLRDGNRALGTYATSVKYKDPVRSFTGRDKYKRQLWATDALEKPKVSVQQMAMLSTSLLCINWTLRGKPKAPFIGIAGDLIVKINSRFTLNQISGQVIEHEESWDLSESPLIARLYFWASRRLFATIESGKDVSDSIKDLTKRISTENKNVEIYPDPTGDPTKFFQRDDSFQRDVYQIALVIALLYFLVQFLKTTL